MDKPLHEVAFTAGFEAMAKAEGVTEAEIEALVKLLSENPEAGELIVGAGGCRKVRLAGRGKGKSGGYRVVTYLPGLTRPIYCLALLSKGARANFSDAQIAMLAKAAKGIKGENRKIAG